MSNLVSVVIDEDIIKRAKENRMNISKFCRDALRKELDRIELINRRN